MPRPRKFFPLSYALSLRKRGYSYEMISHHLWHNLGIDVSKWTVMRRLRAIELAKEKLEGKDANSKLTTSVR